MGKKIVKKAVKKTAAKKNPSKKKVASHLECKCSKKSGGVKIFRNARKNPSDKVGFIGKCDVYTKPNGDVIVIPQEKNTGKKKSKSAAKPKPKAKPVSKKKTKKNPDSKKKWMQDLDLKKGSLREYIADEFGEKGFEMSKKSGNYIIRPEVLKEIANDKSLPEKRQREAQLAIKFNKVRKNKR